ncbi:MAG: Hsp20/alpha crystallin family protein [Thermoplasmata archaeon]|nr:MAG: Hsp20/alpha crystallin family protein [Thermoplasmata archaeon]
MVKKKEKKDKETKKETKSKKPEIQVVREPALWTPEDFERSLDEEFEEFKRNLERSLWWPTKWGAPIRMKWPEIELATARQPLIDIKDTGSELVIKAEVPGIPKENLDIQLTENSIEIRGKLKTEEEEEKEGYYRHERNYSTYYRQMTLPAQVIPSKADAKLEDGILQIKIPKKKQTGKEKAHKVDVK